MSTLKVKLFGCLLWALCLLALSSSQRASSASAGSHAAPPDERPRVNPKPDPAMIDRLDKAVQARFLTEQFLGISRITPPYPPNPHLREFHPENDEEKSAVAALRGIWKVSLHLFGRRAYPKVVDGKDQPEFAVKYRLNLPVVVTGKVKARKLPKAGKLMKEVRRAFLEFQRPGGAHENSYEFNVGGWAYVARPVRASSASCLKCHADYVVTERVGGDRYKFRRRRVGDANGVLVYGFARAE